MLISLKDLAGIISIILLTLLILSEAEAEAEARSYFQGNSKYVDSLTL